MRVRTPTSAVEPHERVLSAAEVATLACTISVREIASDRDGIILSSEVVTETEELGFIYRYDVSATAHDGDGSTLKVNMKFVIWSRDCKSFAIASYPTFRFSSAAQK